MPRSVEIRGLSVGDRALQQRRQRYLFIVGEPR
jgi:hypothetical protein